MHRIVEGVRARSRLSLWTWVLLLAAAGACHVSRAGIRHAAPAAVVELDSVSLGFNVSPDGTQVALRAPRAALSVGSGSGATTSGRGVAVMTADGDALTIVSPTDGLARWGGVRAWSPDGSHLLCDYDSEEFGQAWLFGVEGYGIINLRSGETSWGSYKVDDERPMWDPNQGAEIVLASPEEEDELWEAARQKGIRRPSTPLDPRGDDPFLIETHDVGDARVPNKSLWLRNPDGTRGSLVMDVGRFSSAKVSPDRGLAAIRDVQSGIYLIRADGSDLTPVRSEEWPSPEEGWVTLQTWSPDSKRLYVRTRPRESEPGDIVCRIWSFDILEDLDAPAQQD